MLAKTSSALPGGTEPHEPDTAADSNEDLPAAELAASNALLRAEVARLKRAQDDIERLAVQARNAAVLEERNRLARDIHDGLAQSFTGIIIKLGVAQRISGTDSLEAWNLVERVLAQAREGLADARRSVWALQPNADEYSDLAQSLSRLVNRITEHTAVSAQVIIHGQVRLLPSYIGMNLLRITEEAMNNAVGHGKAENVFVELTFEDEQVKVLVQDDGKGFELKNQGAGGGFGLIGMQQRCDRIGGILTISSSPGMGAEVAVSAPVALEPHVTGAT
jgi:signal transduction histidine kinase